jgi:DNA-binding PadR family transcriptional regulator
MRRPDTPNREPEAQLPLSAATFQILMALADGERHGYAIMREVAEESGGAVRLGPGTLYGSLKRLLEGGLVQEGAERTDPSMGDERRRYYQITDFGLAVARAEARRLDGLLRSARLKQLIGPERA